jgi:group II intron reverse transcriptase/maturase
VKPPNNEAGATPVSAEAGEPREVPAWNLQRDAKSRAQIRVILHEQLLRVRQKAATDKQVQFNTLWHHVYDHDRLAETFFRLRKDGATGVDEVDWHTYEANLEANIRDLSARLKRGAYHAKPVRRAYILKMDGKRRPLGITTLEDKLVQRTTAEVLSAIYETDFLDCSYGFRPGRGQHNALDRVTVSLEREKINWVLDIDIRAFFDSIDHECLITFVQHRITDTRVIRHLKKWLQAGVWEKGEVQIADFGTPQGGSISPLMANIYLHYALDVWAMEWKQQHAKGNMRIVRFADDVVACFQYRKDAEQFQAALRARLISAVPPGIAS